VPPTSTDCCSSKAIFVDTDNVPAIETRAGDLVQNPTEAALLYTFARALVASGVPQGDIAAITPYRQQIKLLSSLFASMPRVELLTADKAQGRDKDVVLVSLVRSNESGTVSKRHLRQLKVFDAGLTFATGRRPPARLAPYQCLVHARPQETRHFREQAHALD